MYARRPDKSETSVIHIKRLSHISYRQIKQFRHFMKCPVLEIQAISGGKVKIANTEFLPDSTVIHPTGSCNTT